MTLAALFEALTPRPKLIMETPSKPNTERHIFVQFHTPADARALSLNVTPAPDPQYQAGRGQGRGFGLQQLQQQPQAQQWWGRSGGGWGWGCGWATGGGGGAPTQGGWGGPGVVRGFGLQQAQQQWPGGSVSGSGSVSGWGCPTGGRGAPPTQVGWSRPGPGPGVGVGRGRGERGRGGGGLTGKRGRLRFTRVALEYNNFKPKKLFEEAKSNHQLYLFRSIVGIPKGAAIEDIRAKLQEYGTVKKLQNWWLQLRSAEHEPPRRMSVQVRGANGAVQTKPFWVLPLGLYTRGPILTYPPQLAPPQPQAVQHLAQSQPHTHQLDPQQQHSHPAQQEQLPPQLVPEPPRFEDVVPVSTSTITTTTSTSTTASPQQQEQLQQQVHQQQHQTQLPELPRFEDIVPISTSTTSTSSSTAAASTASGSSSCTAVEVLDFGYGEEEARCGYSDVEFNDDLGACSCEVVLETGAKTLHIIGEAPEATTTTPTSITTSTSASTATTVNLTCCAAPTLESSYSEPPSSRPPSPMAPPVSPSNSPIPYQNLPGTSAEAAPAWGGAMPTPDNVAWAEYQFVALCAGGIVGRCASVSPLRLLPQRVLCHKIGRNWIMGVARSVVVTSRKGSKGYNDALWFVCLSHTQGVLSIQSDYRKSSACIYGWVGRHHVAMCEELHQATATTSVIVETTKMMTVVRWDGAFATSRTVVVSNMRWQLVYNTYGTDTVAMWPKQQLQATNSTTSGRADFVRSVVIKEVEHVQWIDANLGGSNDNIVAFSVRKRDKQALWIVDLEKTYQQGALSILQELLLSVSGIFWSSTYGIIGAPQTQPLPHWSSRPNFMIDIDTKQVVRRFNLLGGKIDDSHFYEVSSTGALNIFSANSTDTPCRVYQWSSDSECMVDNGLMALQGFRRVNLINAVTGCLLWSQAVPMLTSRHALTLQSL